ncbi:hypothetical protein E2562_035139 [Oryza meyeriana var. granulata]|uniref:Bifunctional inhibitor/plant lipid transfer protein/seed storage helical domain-containing protein n=1 Tax=Oryza meyeriana var. granulata TaxID=110450 RepID=A0A6G1F1L8_9ORYZ|nr:hypothetical protein E2562_035139 [Oryza meyeriana var. granulata]
MARVLVVVVVVVLAAVVVQDAMAQMPVMPPAVVPPAVPTTPPASAVPCVAELEPCSQFYKNASMKPTRACCTPLKKAYESELRCLCSVLTNPAMVGAVGIDRKKGLGLFERCAVKVPADSSH